jgi:hypothetical protein
MFYLDVTQMSSQTLQKCKPIAKTMAARDGNVDNQPAAWNLQWDEAHQCFSHVSSKVLESTAQKIGLKLLGPKAICRSCAMGKTKPSLFLMLTYFLVTKGYEGW